MTSKSKFSVLAVILVTLMVSCAFVPAVNALSNTDDETPAIMTSEETETQYNGDMDILGQLASMLGLDKDSGLKDIIDSLGLSELLDQETIDRIRESSLNPSELLKIFSEKIPGNTFDFSKFIPFLSDIEDLNGTYHFDELDIGIFCFKDLTLTIEISEAETLEMLEIEAGEITADAFGSDDALKGLRILAETGQVCVQLDTAVIDGETYDLEFDSDLILDDEKFYVRMSMHHYGIGFEVDFAKMEKSIHFHIPQFTLDDSFGEYSGAVLESVTVIVTDKNVLDVHIHKATKGGQDITEDLTKDLDKQLQDGFTKQFTIPATIGDVTVTSGIVNVDYKQPNKPLEVHVDIGKIEYNDGTVTVTVDEPDLLMHKDAFDFDFKKVTAATTVQEQPVIFELGAYSFCWFYETDILDVDLDYLSLAVGSGNNEFVVNWGSTQESDPKSFDLKTSTEHFGGIGINLLTAKVDVEAYGQQIPGIIPATHTYVTVLDEMTRVVSITKDLSGVCDKYFSAEYSGLNGTEYIQMRLIDNDPTGLDKIASVTLYYPEGYTEPFVDYAFGVGVGDPTGTFASVMHCSIDGADGMEFTYTVKPDTADPGSLPRFTANIQLTDDTLVLLAYADHYKIGNVEFYQTGMEFSIHDGTCKTSVYGDGIVIKDDKNELSIGSTELGMIFDSVQGTAVYSITASSIIFNNKLAGLDLEYTIFENGETTTIEGDAFMLNLDLGSDGIKIDSGKVIKGTATLENDVVNVDLHLDGAPEAIHFRLNGNTSVDICFHLTSKVFDIEFKADSTGVTLGMNISSFDDTFTITNARYDVATDSLKIDQFNIKGNGEDLVSIGYITLQQTATGFNVSSDTILVHMTSLIKADVDMGTDAAKAFELKTENTDDGVKRTVNANVKTFDLTVEDRHVSTKAGQFTEVSVNGLDQSASATLNTIHICQVDQSENVIVSAGKVQYTLTDGGTSTVITDLLLNTQQEQITADTVTMSVTIDADKSSVTQCFKTHILTITETGNDANPPLTVTDFESDIITTISGEEISTGFVMTVGTVNFNKDASNKIDIKDVKISYDESTGFAFTFDHIDVDLHEYEFKPTESKITADIHMSKDKKDVTFKYQADQIVIKRDNDNRTEITGLAIEYITDNTGAVTKNLFDMGSAMVRLKHSSFDFTRTATFDITGVVIDGKEGTFSIQSIAASDKLTYDDSPANAEVTLYKHTASVNNIEATVADGLLVITIENLTENIQVLSKTFMDFKWNNDGDTPAIKLAIPYKVSDIKTDLFELSTTTAVIDFMDKEYTATFDCHFKATIGTDKVLTLTGSARASLIHLVEGQKETVFQISLQDAELKVNLGSKTSGTLVSLKGTFSQQILDESCIIRIDEAALSINNNAYTLKFTGSAVANSASGQEELTVQKLTISYNLINSQVTGSAEKIFLKVLDEDDGSVAEITAEPVLSGTMIIDLDTGDVKADLTVDGKYTAAVTEGDVKTTYTVTTKDTLAFVLTDDEEDEDYYEVSQLSWMATVTKMTIAQDDKTVDVNINQLYLYANYSAVDGIDLTAGAVVDFSFSLPVGQDHKNLTIRGAEFGVSYNPDEGYDIFVKLDSLVYGTDSYTIEVANFRGSLQDGFLIDAVNLSSSAADNKVSVSFDNCLYYGQFYAGSMSGTVNGVDVAHLNYAGGKLTPADFYNGTFYFSYTEGIKAFKTGEPEVFPDDAIVISVFTADVTFAQGEGQRTTYEIPLNDVITLDGYYDIYDRDGYFALTTNSYSVAPHSVTVSPAKTIDQIIDDTGVVQVKGSGIVYSPETLEKIAVENITIKTGGDITVKIALSALKRLQTDTSLTMLGFTKELADEDNIADVIREMNDENREKALAGTLVIVDVGNSTFTDGLGTVEITVPFYLGDKDPAKLTAYYINGSDLDQVSTVVYKDGYVTFTTNHFSTFLICEGLSVPADRDWLVVIVTIAVALAVILIMTAVVMRDKKAA